MPELPKIFLAHASEDREQVAEVYHRLRVEGFFPWLDKEDLFGGQNWQEEIPKAIKSSDFALVFLSKVSVSKRGYVQKEFKLALEVLDEMPEGQIFIIPVRLEDCNVPTKFEKLHYVNLYEEGGIDNIVTSIIKHASLDNKRLLRGNASAHQQELIKDEFLFISCSWIRGETGKWGPHPDALQLHAWLNRDFGAKGGEHIQVHLPMLDVKPGNRFLPHIYEMLDRATLAVVFMMADNVVRGSSGVDRKYCKPNVYHEAGYLMSRLRGGRVILLVEKGVHMPSNTFDSIFIQIERSEGGLSLIYDDLIEWLTRRCNKTSDVIRNKALKRHLGQVKKLVQEGKINFDAYEALIEVVNHKLNGSE